MCASPFQELGDWLQHQFDQSRALIDEINAREAREKAERPPSKSWFQCLSELDAEEAQRDPTLTRRCHLMTRRQRTTPSPEEEPDANADGNANDEARDSMLETAFPVPETIPGQPETTIDKRTDEARGARREIDDRTEAIQETTIGKRIDEARGARLAKGLPFPDTLEVQAMVDQLNAPLREYYALADDISLDSQMTT